MNFIRKLSILKIFCFLFCMTTNAGIPTLAFKNVFSCFKPEKTYCAPNFGAIALRAGIIENIRFNLVQQAFNADQTRDYKKDKPYDGKDPLVTMALILFPSHAGQLATEANTNDNLGQHCTVEHVANLLKFTDAVRTYFDKSKVPLPQNITKVPAKLGLTPNWITKNLPTDAGITKNRNNLLTNIIQAVQREASNTFYPKYLIEQIISAFFCHKFTSTDIPILLQALGSNFVDETKIVAQEFITQEDIQSAMAKSLESLTLDDIWLRLISDDISSPIPYSSNPISNGLAKMYTKNPVQEFNITFADCTESVIRHILNLTLYDPVQKIFDLSKLIEHMKHQNPDFDPEQDLTFKYFKEFYDKQTTDKANDGTHVTRSLWNKVVADLGNEIEYLRDAGGRKSNELNSGMINILQVLNKLFDLNLKPRPTKSDSSEFISQAQQWIQESLETFLACAGNKKFALILSDLKIQSSSKYGDIVGKIMVTASENSADLFSYTIHSMQGHAQIEGLKKLQELIKFATPSDTANPFLHKNTTFESLLLLKDDSKKEAITLFYKLFSEPLNDNDAIINTLKKLYTLLKNSELNNSQLLETLIKNILSAFPWQDGQANENIFQILFDFRAYAGEDKVYLRNALQENVKGFILSDKTVSYFADFFKNIEYLFVDKVESFDFSASFGPTIRSIQPLRRVWCYLKKLSGLEHCQNLESLNLLNVFNLKEIVFLSSMNSLKEMNLAETDITNIIGLEHCQSLVELNLSQTKNLKKIKFSKNIPSLRIINLHSSNIKKIVGLEYCQSLEIIDLSSTEKLEEIIFSNLMNSLKKINLARSYVKKIVGLEYCQSLEIINLSSTKQLEEIVFSNPMNSLKEIDLYGSKIQKITGLEYCQELRHLDIIKTMHLDEITFSGPMNQLDTISISDCSLKKITGLELCKELMFLHIKNTHNLEEVIFSQPMKHLYSIEIKNSSIKRIFGLELCKEIDLEQFKIENPTIQLIPASNPPESKLDEKIEALGNALNDLKNRLTEIKNSLGILKSSM